MPHNDPNAYNVPGDPSSGARPGAGNPGNGNPGAPGVNPGPPQVQRTGAPILAGSGDLEQEVIAGYMSLKVDQKQKLLRAMDSELGPILLQVLPDSLGSLILEAINTPPEAIVDGLTPPKVGAAPPGALSSAAIPQGAGFGLPGAGPAQAVPAAPPGTLSSAAIPRGNNVLNGFR